LGELRPLSWASNEYSISQGASIITWPRGENSVEGVLSVKGRIPHRKSKKAEREGAGESEDSADYRDNG